MLSDVIEYAKIEREELIAQGKEVGKLEVAINMLRENLPIDIVARATELPKEQIKKLAV